MKKRNPTPFNVIVQDINRQEFGAYDIMPYLMNCWESEKKSKPRARELPTDLKGLHQWIDRRLMYQYWSRCEYEVIVQGWPNQSNEQKIDVYWQAKMNLPLITQVFIDNMGLKF